MKRKALLKHLEKRGCLLLREGANHSVFLNEKNKKISTVPRHSEIYEILVRKICRDLEIDLP